MFALSPLTNLNLCLSFRLTLPHKVIQPFFDEGYTSSKLELLLMDIRWLFPQKIPKTEGICVWSWRKLRGVIFQQKFSQIGNAVENIHVLTWVCVIPRSITLIENFNHHMHGVFFIHLILLFLKQCSACIKKCRPFKFQLVPKLLAYYTVKCVQKKATLNIHEYSIFFTSRKSVWLLGFEKNCYCILSAQLCR